MEEEEIEEEASNVEDETIFDLSKKFEDDLFVPSKESLLRLSPEKSTVTLTWKEVEVFVKIKSFKYFRYKTSLKQVIFNVSGTIRPGELVALMGPSGSGKSTLLAALAHRYQGGTVVKGDVKINGKTIDKRFRNISGFMFQDDFFIKELTVKEHLLFMARFKMNRNSTEKEKVERVESLIEAFALGHVRNRKIGGKAQEGEKSVLSGGEKRRLSLATAMINFPKIIFADEPTTGLDSFNAHRVVSTMKNLSKSIGSPVLCSIHQPIPETLALFDKVILMAEGRLMFAGKVDEAVEFYRSCGFVEDKFMSHAEFIIKCISPAQSTRGSQDTTEKLADEFLNSKYYKKFKKQIDSENYDKADLVYRDFDKQWWITNFFLLIWRTLLVEVRAPEDQWLAIVQKVILGFVCGLCFSKITNTDQDGIQGVQGALFLLVTENTYAPMYSVMYAFPKIYPQFLTEYYNGAYPATAFYSARVVGRIPGYVIESLVFSLILYYMANLRNTLYATALTQIFAVLCIVISTAFGTLFANVFSNVPTSVTYMVPFDYLMMITAGIFVRIGSLNVLFRWLNYCSWFYYVYESYTILQWDGIEKITCNKDRIDIPCMPSGEDVIKHYDFFPDNLVRNSVALLAMFVLIHTLGMLFFIYKVKKQA